MGDPGLNEAQFAFTGAPQDWTVPAGVHLVLVQLAGANPPDNGQGIEAQLEVSPGDVLHLFVGGPPDAAGNGGWNGGGAGQVLTGGFLGLDWTSSAGYGATDVRRGGTSETDRILVSPGSCGVSWDNRGPEPGFVFGDLAVINGELGYSIRSTIPTASETPRALRQPPLLVGETFTLAQAGTPGGTSTGGDATSGTGYSVGAGGGGAGGGASGSVYIQHSADPMVDGQELWVGGNTGGWYAAPGIAAVAGGGRLPVDPPSEGYTGGGVRLQWRTGALGWNVGHLGG